MPKDNKIKKRLRNGEAVLGSWLVMPSADVVNVIASTGLDFIIIDMEHGPHSYTTAADMIRAAETEDCSPLLRVSKNEESLILKALDLDVHGVIVPHIESKYDAQNAILYSKYYPQGQRGFSPYTRAGRYSMHNISDHSSVHNNESMVILILEGKKGIEELDDILNIKNIKSTIDVIYIGAYDLSQALGMPGKVDHPEVKGHMEECVKKIRGKGLAAGGYVAKSKEDMIWMYGIGMQFITLLPDCTVLYHAYENLKNDFKTVIK